MIKRIVVLNLLFLLVTVSTNAQYSTDKHLSVDTISSLNFWEPAQSFNKKRFRIGSSVAIGAYTVASLGLYNAWYRDSNIGRFHLFDDRKEWEYMDKFGHLMSAYFESNYAYKVAHWSGLNKSQSILTGILTGTVVQSTIEIMDGFSEKWGFSYLDMAMNFVGVLTFASQQSYWDDQRIKIKVSSYYRAYNEDLFFSIDNKAQSSIHIRTNDLFGKSILERYLKDYNNQTYWASFNIKSFLKDHSKFPSYLNLALGYGAENMYGGFKNKWQENGIVFELNEKDYPRYHQFYIGLDIDLSKIETKNHFLKTVFSVFNIFKMPMPAIEFNTKGQILFHVFKI